MYHREIRKIERSKDMYSFKSKVRYSETGADSRLTLWSLMDYFQDCSTFHSKEVDLSVEHEIENKRAWVVSYWQIEIDRYPLLYENIETGTFPTSFKGACGNRNFFIKDEEGKYVARAKSVWAYVDAKSGRPIRIPDEEAKRYGTDSLFELEDLGRKIKGGINLEPKEPFKVRKEYIDVNKHVNNCRYVEMAAEYIPEDLIVKKLRVCYIKSALYGDTIYPYVSKEEDRTVIELSDENKKPYCIVEII